MLASPGCKIILSTERSKVTSGIWHVLINGGDAVDIHVEYQFQPGQVQNRCGLFI